MIAIIIVNYNTKTLLEKCILSLQKAAENLTSQIIVVDNASTDGSVELIQEKFLTIKLIINKNNLGFAKAVNLAINSISADYYLLVNSDMIVNESAIKKMLEIIATDKNIGILGCQLIYPDGRVQASVGKFPSKLTEFFTKTRLYKIFNYGRYFVPKFKELTYLDWVSGGFMLIKKAVINKIMGFDENFFMYLEDIDFCRRAKDAGFRIAFTPEVKILHYHQGSAGKNLALANNYERESLKYYKEKHNQ